MDPPKGDMRLYNTQFVFALGALWFVLLFVCLFCGLLFWCLCFVKALETKFSATSGAQKFSFRFCVKFFGEYWGLHDTCIDFQVIMDYSMKYKGNILYIIYIFLNNPSIFFFFYQQ